MREIAATKTVTIINTTNEISERWKRRKKNNETISPFQLHNGLERLLIVDFVFNSMFFCSRLFADNFPSNEKSFWLRSNDTTSE